MDDKCNCAGEKPRSANSVVLNQLWVKLLFLLSMRTALRPPAWLSNGTSPSISTHFREGHQMMSVHHRHKLVPMKKKKKMLDIPHFLEPSQGMPGLGLHQGPWWCYPRASAHRPDNQSHSGISLAQFPTCKLRPEGICTYNMFNKIFGITNPDVISGLLLKIYTYYTCTCTYRRSYIYYQYMILSNILYIIHLSSRSHPYAWFKFYMAAMELANLPTPASDASSNLFCRPSHSDTNSTLGKRWAMLSGWLLVILVVFPILGGNKKNSGEDLTNPYNQSCVTQRICACESCVPYVTIPSMFQHILFSSLCSKWLHATTGAHEFCMHSKRRFRGLDLNQCRNSSI